MNGPAATITAGKGTAARIVSVSRRTDIPAFYAPWLMNRLRAGSVSVANPFNRRQVTTVGLRPEEVACLVFWTRDPRPLIPHLDELEERGYRFFFHVTVTGLPPILEPAVPPAEEVIAAVAELSRRLGRRRIIWRFDPLFITPVTPGPVIADTFARLADRLAGSVERVAVSFARRYLQTERRLRREAQRQGLPPDLLFPSPHGTTEGDALLLRIGREATSRGLSLYSCADDHLATCGIPSGSCIDAGLITDLFGISLPPAKDRGQRPACGCHPSIDIGSYGTCRHGCRYCYAGTDRALGNRRHDPDSPFLLPF